VCDTNYVANSVYWAFQCGNSVMQGYSTLGSQWLMKGYHSNPVLTHPADVKAAHGVHRSLAQVVLRWALQHGQVGSLQYHTTNHIHSFLFWQQ